MSLLDKHVVMIDGRLVEEDQSHISVLDRGFLYGDSVFEVLRTYQGEPFALEEHIERLYRSAREVFIEIPVTAEQLRAEVLEAVQIAGRADNIVRIQVTRGSGPLGLDPFSAQKALRVILVAPLKLPSAHDYENGISAALIRTERTADNTEAAGAKVANYLVSLLALRKAIAAGAKEAIIVDGRGRVLEGASSNVFLIKDKVLLTPPENEGILPGITRMYLLQTAAILNLPVRITTLTRGDLLTADELFISSTVREVLPVVKVDEELIGQGAPGPFTRAIHQEFRKVNGLIGPLYQDQDRLCID